MSAQSTSTDSKPQGSWWVGVEDRGLFTRKVRDRTAALSPKHGSSRAMKVGADGGRGFKDDARQIRQTQAERLQRLREGRASTEKT